MDKLDFISKPQAERDWLIYSVLTANQTAPGKSPIAGVFDRQEIKTPVQEVPSGPDGFTAVFGDYPSNAPYGSAERNQWDNRVKRWGGLYDLNRVPNYTENLVKSAAKQLGAPIGYVFDGDVFVTFPIFKGVNWYRDLSQYMNHYDDMLNAAHLRARQLGLIQE